MVVTSGSIAYVPIDAKGRTQLADVASSFRQTSVTFQRLCHRSFGMTLCLIRKRLGCDECSIPRDSDDQMGRCAIWMATTPVCHKRLRAH